LMRNLLVHPENYPHKLQSEEFLIFNDF